MKNSTNLEVQDFLKKLETQNPEKYEILQKAREVVFKTQPKSAERVMYGGIMFTGDEDWGGLFVSKNHVSFEFSQGFSFNDPNLLLEGMGKFRRHLKITSLDDIEAKQVEFFVEQV